MKKIKKAYDFEAFRKEAEKHYLEKFPNIPPDEARKLIDYAVKIKREKYTPEFAYI